MFLFFHKFYHSLLSIDQICYSRLIVYDFFFLLLFLYSFYYIFSILYLRKYYVYLKIYDLSEISLRIYIRRTY